MTIESWEALRAAASPDSALDAALWTSQLLLRVQQDAIGLKSATLRPKDPRPLIVATDALNVLENLQANARRQQADSSSMLRQAGRILDEVKGLFLIADVSGPVPAHTLDKHRFNEAALAWLEGFEIRPPLAIYTGRFTKEPMARTEIWSRLQSNDDLLGQLLRSGADTWVRETAQWEGLRQPWFKVIEKWCLLSSAIGKELAPA